MAGLRHRAWYENRVTISEAQPGRGAGLQAFGRGPATATKHRRTVSWGGTTRDCQTGAASNLLQVDVVLVPESSATWRTNASIWDREELQRLGPGRAREVSQQM